MTSSKNLQVENKKGRIWVTIPTTISVTNLLAVQQTIESNLTEGPDNVIIDLVNCDTVNSVLASLIINIRNRVVKADGEIGLVNVSEKCMIKLELMQLDRVLSVYDDESEIR